MSRKPFTSTRRNTLLCLIALALPAAAQQLKHLLDPTTGVSFDYPANWRLNRLRGSYFPYTILPPDTAPSASVTLEGRDDPASHFAQSNFLAAEFLTRAVPNITQTQCEAAGDPGGLLPANNETPRARAVLTMQGHRFIHWKSAEQGLSNIMTEDFYATWIPGAIATPVTGVPQAYSPAGQPAALATCLFFEGAISRTAQDTAPKNISDRDLAEIRARLSGIMRSVRLTDAPVH